MEILDRKSPEIMLFTKTLDQLLETISKAFENCTPSLNGEKFLTNRDVGKLLGLSLRTLQDWRDKGVIGYIQISGKILYRQSDILKLLEDGYRDSTA
ncbi:DNA-binding protein [Dysgonomonas sp. 521]|nr:helix-turn-helix domain-containing protein [Dysgonomonas sp. 521]NDV93415.1 DNA-binding protein [Dysgonomonas sp. 521]